MEKTVKKALEGENTTKYKTESLLSSNVFAGYQKDFSRALLIEPEYTIEEARSVLDRFFRKEGKK